MESNQRAIEIMNQLRKLGVKLSIDDFGTGYSNLSYLHRMPVNYLKIDRSFVSRLQTNYENNEIVRTIVMLAKNLGFEVIAEGVETQEQAEQLKMLNCTFGQGYLFSKPLDASQIQALINHLPPGNLSSAGNIVSLNSIS
jgi:EAL domain-containing protein (putative c-di-GMP-specific phosphodiesterase class I)